MIVTRYGTVCVFALAVMLAPGATRGAEAQNAPPFDGRLVSPGVDTLDVRLYMFGRYRPSQPTRSEVDVIVRAPGDTALRRVTRWLRPAPADTIEHADTLWLALPSLAPLTFWSRDSRGSADSLMWVAGRVRGQITSMGSAAVAVDAEASPDIYLVDELELLARAAPLSRKYKTKVRIFDASIGTRQVTLEVTGEGRSPSGTEYWIVATEFFDIPQRFYVEKTGRRLVGKRMELGSGAFMESIPTWASRAPGGSTP